MRLSELWRITTFRLTVLYGLVFALGVAALVGMIYLQSAVFLTRRVDGILRTQADALIRVGPPDIGRRIPEALALNGDQTTVIALFSVDGQWLAGNLKALPPGLNVDGRPLEVEPMGGFPSPARLIARRLASGDELVVGRDVRQLREMRAILTSALVWSGVLIIGLGVACGVVLSIAPIRRLRILSAAGQEIAGGDLQRRMPVSARRDELDMFAGTVNYMMDEVERLMAEVKGATETIAHDLRTPLTRARAQLHRLQQSPQAPAQDIARVTAEIDTVLERFRALLRISELEARDRRAGFAQVKLAAVLEQVVELYQPLAEAGGVTLAYDGGPAPTVEADQKLLFEALSNLVDNAIKFSRSGGQVRLRLLAGPQAPVIVVEDDGAGIPAGERAAVLQRFYRGERDRLIPGSGLGLSIVVAIVRLHRFELRLEDAEPGLRAVIDCNAVRRPSAGETLFTGPLSPRR